MAANRPSKPARAANRLKRPAPTPPGVSSVLARNIKTLSERKRRAEEAAPLQERMAAAVTRFAGSMGFVYLHIAFFGFWIAANLGLVPRVRPWDPSLVMLAMWASVEAIFLSTFVLISQNRMAAADDKRADLDLQVTLLSEHEITKLASLLEAIAARLDVKVDLGTELEEVTQDIAPEAVLDEIEQSAPTPAS